MPEKGVISSLKINVFSQWFSTIFTYAAFVFRGGLRCVEPMHNIRGEKWTDM